MLAKVGFLNASNSDKLWSSYVGQSCCTNHCCSYFTTSLFSVGLKRLCEALSSLPFTPTKSLYSKSLCKSQHDPLQPVTRIQGPLFIHSNVLMLYYCDTSGCNFNPWLELSTVVFTLQWHALGTGGVTVGDKLSHSGEDNLWMAIWPF